MKNIAKAMRLYAITDRRWSTQDEFYDQVKEALKGGITCLQLREKDLDDDSFYKEAMIIKDTCKDYNVSFIINDNVRVAVESGADGIHIGQDDMDLKEVRKLVAKNMIIGVSAQTVDQAKAAEKNGADYLGVGAVYPTGSKDDADVIKREILEEICKSVNIPVVAIGGITEENILELKGAGVDGVSIISDIFGAEDISDKCKRLKVLSEEMVAGD